MKIGDVVKCIKDCDPSYLRFDKGSLYTISNIQSDVSGCEIVREDEKAVWFYIKRDGWSDSVKKFSDYFVTNIERIRRVKKLAKEHIDEL